MRGLGKMFGSFSGNLKNVCVPKLFSAQKKVGWNEEKSIPHLLLEIFLLFARILFPNGRWRIDVGANRLRKKPSWRSRHVHWEQDSCIHPQKHFKLGLKTPGPRHLQLLLFIQIFLNFLSPKIQKFRFNVSHEFTKKNNFCQKILKIRIS